MQLLRGAIEEIMLCLDVIVMIIILNNCKNTSIFSLTHFAHQHENEIFNEFLSETDNTEGNSIYTM